MKNILLPCDCCDGKGIKHLERPLLRTYNAISELVHPTIPEIGDYLKERVHHTAINRRVERLMAKKLVKRKKIPHDGVRYFIP